MTSLTPAPIPIKLYCCCSSHLGEEEELARRVHIRQDYVRVNICISSLGRPLSGSSRGK